MSRLLVRVSEVMRMSSRTSDSTDLPFRSRAAMNLRAATLTERWLAVAPAAEVPPMPGRAWKLVPALPVVVPPKLVPSRWSPDHFGRSS